MKKKSAVMSVPVGRISRAAGFGSMIARVAFGTAIQGSIQVLKGDALTYEKLLLSEKNIIRFVAELSKMRGAALKVGQLLSLEAGDFLPSNIAGILSSTRDKAYYMPPYQLGEVLRQNFGNDFLDNFLVFDEIPIAAASIGQVHKCKTMDNKNLIIKVQYPGIKSSINSDISNLILLLKASKILPPSINIDDIMNAGKEQLHNETNYILEAKHQQYFHRILKNDKVFEVPAINKKLSSATILAMEFKEGVTIEKIIDFDQKTKNRIMCSMVDLIFREIFEFKKMQTDPNYANFLYNKDTRKIILLDFGATTSISNKIVSLFTKILKETIYGNKNSVEFVLKKMNLINDSIPRNITSQILNIYWESSKNLRENKLFDFNRSFDIDEFKGIGIDLFNNKEKIQIPDPDLLFIQRKIGGVFLLGRRLNAKINLRSIIQKYL